MKSKKLFLSLAVACCLGSAPSYANTSVGAYVDYDGWSLNTIDQFNADTARHAATINIFSNFDTNWHNLAQQSSNIVSRNAVPMVTWMPYSSATPDANILQEITQGHWDSYITSWIEGFKSWQSTYAEENKPSILLRFGHEFNGNWYGWGNQPDNLKLAWRYLHNKFTEAGVNDSVGWVWCANNVDVDSYNDVLRYYPGDDVVDWLSIDGYNWGSNYSFTRWKSFDETFSYQYVKMVTAIPNKPVMLAEVSSAEAHDVPDPDWGQDGDDSDAMESKEAWTADMLSRIQENYSAIKSIVWFNTNKELSWALNQDGNTGLNAYNSAVVGDYFGSVMNVKTMVAAPAPEEEPVKVKGKGKPRKAARGTVIEEVQVTQEPIPLSGIERAMTHTNLPDVVGEHLLKKESDGLRAMPKDKLQKWRARW